jgi:hypothetical protein
VAIGNAPGNGAVLYVKLWNPGETSDAVPAAQKYSSTAFCLTSDLIAASGGVICEAREQILSAQFSAFQIGVMAARRLQWAAQGFSETENLREMAVAVLVQHAEDALLSITDDASSHLLELAAPGQILLTEKAGKFLEEMAGFSLGNASDAGLRELLWRGPDERATRSFDDQAIARFVEEKGPEVYAKAYSEKLDTSAIGSSPEGRDADRRGQVGHDGPSVSGSSLFFAHSGRRWLIGGAAAAVLLLAAIPVFHLFGGKAPSTVSNPAPANSTVALPGQQTPIQTAPTTQPAIFNPAFKPAAQKIQQASDLRHQDQVKSRSDRQSGEEEPQKLVEVIPKPQPSAQSKSRCDLDQNQLGGQIEQAEKSLARGKYKDALRQFDSVLACEPGNARAQEGLSRAHLAQSTEESAP